MPKMLVTLLKTMTNNKKQRPMSSRKQTQTKPILPACMAGKIALPALECRYRGSAAEGPIKTTVRLRRIYVVQKVAGLKPNSRYNRVVK